jgi:PAS domain-containing protein
MRSEMTCPIETDPLPLIDRVLAADRAADRAAPARPVTRAADAAPTLSRVLAAHGASAGVLDALVDALPVGVALLDRQGHMVYANAAARAFPIDELPALRRTVAVALTTGLTRRVERLECGTSGSVRQGGARRWLDAVVVPVGDAGGATVGALLTITDETTHIQATEWRPLIDSLARL